MKSLKDDSQYFFVDESGDPNFYDSYGRNILKKPGCSDILILGFIKTQFPEIIRQNICKLREDVKNDQYLAKVPSLEKTLRFFHAKDDCPEVRERVFKLIKTLDFKCQMVVARKIENVFIKVHKKNPNLFYDSLVTVLFQNQLHDMSTNTIYFATKANKPRRIPLESAITKAVKDFENKYNIKVNAQIGVHPQTPIGEPCIQVVDYMNWALQRAYSKKETRYLDFVMDKISLITDIYDFEKYPRNYYNRKNPFSLDKIVTTTEKDNEPPVTSPR